MTKERPSLSHSAIHADRVGSFETRCLQRALAGGKFGGPEVVNLFPLRSTDPDRLLTHPAPLGDRPDRNNRAITDAIVERPVLPRRGGAGKRGAWRLPWLLPRGLSAARLSAWPPQRTAFSAGASGPASGQQGLHRQGGRGLWPFRRRRLQAQGLRPKRLHPRRADDRRPRRGQDWVAAHRFRHGRVIRHHHLQHYLLPGDHCF